MTTSGILLIAMLSALSPDGKVPGHSGLLKAPCIECHTHLPFAGRTATLHEDVGETCGTCHQTHHGTNAMRSHPVNTVPSMRPPRDMLLDDRGRITCITCHVFHGESRDAAGNKQFYLRRSRGIVFCHSCHKNFPGGKQKLKYPSVPR